MGFVVGKPEPAKEPVRVWLEADGETLTVWAQYAGVREVVLEIEKGGRINRHAVDPRIAAAAGWTLTPLNNFLRQFGD